MKNSVKTQDQGSTHGLIAAILVAGVVVIAPGCGKRAVSPAPVKPSKPVTAPKEQLPSKLGKMPTSVADVGEYGENAYDAVAAGKWSDASSALDKLQLSQQKMVNDLPDQENAKKELATAIAALQKSIAGKNRQESLLNANKVTLIAAEISSAYTQTVPVAITKLDYYGRELKIWSAAKDQQMLKKTATNLEQTWTSVQSNVISRGGKTQAQQFNALVDQLKSAKTPSQYDAVADRILDQVDLLENVYSK